MKRIISSLLLLLCLFALSGCGIREADSSALWVSALDTLKQRSSYTVVENGMVSRYTPECSQTETEDGTVYYSLTDGICEIWVHNDDPDVWLRSEIPASENFFYAYELIERLNKLGGYIDMGLLHYDAEEQCFRGEELGQPYVYRGEVHAPQLLEIQIDDGVIVSLRETWERTDEAGNSVIMTDEVSFEDFFITNVHLPLNTVAYDEGEETENAQNSQG